MAGQKFSNYNYPSANVNVNVGSGGGTTIGDINVNLDNAKLYDRFLLMDELESFRAIPRKYVENGVGTYDILIPYTLSVELCNWHLFRRRLYLNTKSSTYGVAVGNKKFIPIVRPEGHKAFLHTVSYAAYDFNEMLPALNIPAANIVNRIVENAFGTGVHGLKLNSTPIELAAEDMLPKSKYFTTAHYPVYFDSTGRRGEEITVMEALGQAGPRSSIRGGMLPGDFLMNNFWMQIKGFTAETPDFTSPGSTYANIWESPEENKSYGVDADAESTDVTGKTDMFIPGISNEIDTLIPDDVNWLCVDVAGAGWRHGAFEHSYEAEPSSSYKQFHKGLGVMVEPFFTYVQMPVKVQIDIRYWPIPVEPVEGGGLG